jgi:hypothetical protein
MSARVLEGASQAVVLQSGRALRAYFRAMMALCLGGGETVVLGGASATPVSYMLREGGPQTQNNGDLSFLSVVVHRRL